MSLPVHRFLTIASDCFSAKMLLSDRRSRLAMDIIEACECLRQGLGVLEKDEKELRVLEKEALHGAQRYDFSGDDEFYHELIDDFHRETVEDDQWEMERLRAIFHGPF
ncbi:hypothetical protein E4U52_003434 [Claviceps spartinae]|nr:hypothetical protein E4U52_003434 [Claviceps spartinae]